MSVKFYTDKRYLKTEDKSDQDSKLQEIPHVADLIQMPVDNIDPNLARTVFFNQEINEESSTLLRAQLLAMVAEDKEAPIRLMLGSPGGELYESFAIYDTIKMLPTPVIAVCSGKVMSGCVLILLACNKRFATTNTTFMLHHGHSTISGNVLELDEQLKEIKSLNNRMLNLIINDTDITIDHIDKWLIREHYLNVDQAIKHKLIDGVITKLEDLE